jgi:hypothetical protein
MGRVRLPLLVGRDGWQKARSDSGFRVGDLEIDEGFWFLACCGFGVDIPVSSVEKLDRRRNHLVFQIREVSALIL